jgi:hypothetical protein
MWIVFQKSDHQVIGSTADSDQDPEKAAAIDEVVRNLAKPPAAATLDAIQVKDRSKAQELLHGIGRGRVTIVESGGKLDVLSKAPDTSILIASAETKDVHPVDKIPLIPGDGKSFLRITVAKTDSQGAARTSKTDDTDLLWLRTTNGSLREDTASDSLPQEIRSIRLAAGTATFRLYSEPAKRLATVQILCQGQSPSDTMLRVEFT